MATSFQPELWPTSDHDAIIVKYAETKYRVRWRSASFALHGDTFDISNKTYSVLSHFSNQKYIKSTMKNTLLAIFKRAFKQQNQ